MITANNKAELISMLADMDITVPPRSQGRVKEHTERYAITYLLSTLAKENMLKFPLSLHKNERPDFVLSMAGEKLGIEHTEAVARNVAHSDFLRGQGHGENVHFIRRSEPGERRLTAKKLLAEIEKNEPGGPWMGNSVERDWDRAMSFFTREKCASAAKEGYELFATNALLIYDNWRLPALQVSEAAEMFLMTCRDEGYFDTFGIIYVHSGSEICRLTKLGVSFYDIKELWEGS